jgi:hypothetical protein
MLLTHRHFLALSLASLLHVASAQTQRPDALVVTHEGSNYVLQVPVSKLVLVVPDSGLTNEALNIGGSTSSPRYFNFSDSKHGIVISGWFEPASQFKGLQTFWENEQASWKKNGLPDPHNASIGSIGGWQTISYELKLPTMSNRHVRAHLVKAGTWIDLHISVTSSAPDASSPEAILKNIAVNEKPNL